MPRLNNGVCLSRRIYFLIRSTRPSLHDPLLAKEQQLVSLCPILSYIYGGGYVMTFHICYSNEISDSNVYKAKPYRPSMCHEYLLSNAVSSIGSLAENRGHLRERLLFIQSKGHHIRNIKYQIEHCIFRNDYSSSCRSVSRSVRAQFSFKPTMSRVSAALFRG